MEQVIRTGRQAALAAGAVLRQSYLKPHRVRYKGDIDPVTEADLQSQEMIVGLIRRVFPDHGFLAEETGAGLVGGKEGAIGPPRQEDSDSGQPARPRWIIDPLDGTVNFAHGFPMFCVSIAYEAEGRMAYGVIYDPLRDELFEAWPGAGARLNGEPIHVSGTDRMERALMTTGFPYDIRERLPETTARMGRFLGVVQGLRRAGSAALDMCYVASGRFDAFYEENLKPWDTAAGLLIVAEAGGRITTFEGGLFDIYAPNIAASNGLLHDRVLEMLRL